MGGKQSTPTEKGQSQVVDISHPRFGKTTIRGSGEEGSAVLEVVVAVPHQTEIRHWAGSYRGLPNQEALLLPIKTEFKGTSMCGSNGSCTVTYDNYQFILREEISDRTGIDQKHFTSTELWYLLFTILEAAHAFHSRGQKIGDVRPLNVFINDNGQAKVANHLSWLGEEDNYVKALLHREITFLAPEEFVDLTQGQTRPKGHFQIAEAFSVGLTLLDSAMLSDSKDLYNLANNRFDYPLLEQRVRNLFNLPNLDGTLKQAIAGLCHPDHHCRLTCRMVYEWLINYRQQIIDFEGFELREVPSFLLNPAFRYQKPRQPPIRPQSQPPQLDYSHLRSAGPLPIYFESQVVSRIPEPRPEPRESTRVVFVQNSPRKVIQTQEPIILESQARHFVVRQQPIQRQSEPVVIERREVIERRQEVPRKDFEPVQHTELTQPLQVRVPSYRMSEGASYTKVGSGAKDDDFRATLSKIEEQLAMSRKMFPS